MIAPTATRQARRRYGGLSHRFLDSVDLPLLSRHHFTAPPSPKRYDNRYEVEGRTNFLEPRTGEVRRITLLGTSVNKGLGSLVCRLTPEPRDPSRNDYGPPDGYELAYSVPGANPDHHLPEEAPRLHTPVHVPMHVTPKPRVLPPFEVRVPYNQT